MRASRIHCDRRRRDRSRSCRSWRGGPWCDKVGDGARSLKLRPLVPIIRAMRLSIVRSGASLLLALSAQPALGQSVDARLYAALSWRNLGPFRGGRVSAVSAPIGPPGVFYMGLPARGGVETTSARAGWFSSFRSREEFPSICPLP